MPTGQRSGTGVPTLSLAPDNARQGKWGHSRLRLLVYLINAGECQANQHRQSAAFPPESEFR
jgi:hypothetical protein